MKYNFLQWLDQGTRSAAPFCFALLFPEAQAHGWMHKYSKDSPEEGCLPLGEKIARGGVQSSRREVVRSGVGAAPDSCVKRQHDTTG